MMFLKILRFFRVDGIGEMHRVALPATVGEVFVSKDDLMCVGGGDSPWQSQGCVAFYVR